MAPPVFPCECSCTYVLTLFHRFSQMRAQRLMRFFIFLFCSFNNNDNLLLSVEIYISVNNSYFINLSHIKTHGSAYAHNLEHSWCGSIVGRVRLCVYISLVYSATVCNSSFDHSHQVTVLNKKKGTLNR